MRRNPIVSKYVKRNDRKKVTFSLKPESNDNVKFSHVQDKDEKNAYRERLSKQRLIGMCLRSMNVRIS